MSIGNEHFYRTTEIIAKEYLNDKRNDVGWIYPSIASQEEEIYRNSQNICFKSKIAYEHLNLIGVRVCQYDIYRNVFRPLPILETIEFNDSDFFEFNSPNEDLWQNRLSKI